MAKNPRFNNKSLFSDVTDEGTENIVLNSTSETLATQGNVINSLKKFWNNLREKLAYSVTRTGTASAVGDDYTPVYVNENGEVYPCNAGMITASINGSGNVTSDLIKTSHTGVIVYLSIDGNAAANPNGTRTLSVAGKEVKYPTGVAVLAKEIAVGSLLLLAYAKSSNSGFWVLLNKVNAVNGTNAGLMTVAEHNKLANIAENANNYSLPIAGSNLGGVKSAETGKTADRDYNVQINGDGTMKVNVPWTDTQPSHYTALLKAGSVSSKENQNTTNGNTYLQVVEDGELSSQLKIVGSNGVNVTSSAEGVVTIEGQQLSMQRIGVSVQDPPTYTVDANGYVSGLIYFKHALGNAMNVRCMYEGKAVGSNSSSFNLRSLKIVASTLTTGVGKTVYIQLYPTNTAAYLPGLLAVTIYPSDASFSATLA